MTKPAVVFDHVSKTFDLHRSRSRSFQELLVNFGRWRQTRIHDELHALQDVSFAITRGETVGFIGANGAGKSTLLKLIARILEPDSGMVTVNGRVGALLELGAGFHPDLTGRENVYLNASIMGLTRREVDRRFDEIVAFSELERFIDVPVKHYSSGMYVRLGFAVAVNMEPEILLVDEVLAVGDQAFQSRCLKRVSEIQQTGTTVVFVSHALNTIRQNCKRVIWIDAGNLRCDGAPPHVIGEYLKLVWGRQDRDGSDTSDLGNRWGSGEARIERVELLDEYDRPVNSFRTWDFFKVRMWYVASSLVKAPAFGIGLYDEDGERLNGPNSTWAGTPVPEVHGRGYVDYVVEHLPLLSGLYDLTVAIYDESITQPYDHWHRMLRFTVTHGDVDWQDGVVYIPHRWECISDAGQPHQFEAGVERR